MVTLQEFRKDLAYRITLPLARLLARTSITPNTLTWIGFVLTVAAAVVIYLGHPFAGGWVVLFAGVFDMLDRSSPVLPQWNHGSSLFSPMPVLATTSATRSSCGCSAPSPRTCSGPACSFSSIWAGTSGRACWTTTSPRTYVPMAISVPWLGASGAIAGILGLAACCFMRAKVRVTYLVLFPRCSVGVATVPMPVFGALWLGWEVFEGLVMTSLAAETGRYGGVAHWAHVGGFAVG